MGMAVVVMMVMGGGGLVGCAISSSAGQKTIADSEMRKRIVVGATTKGEVKALLGEPETLGMDEGEETWGYVYVAGGQVRWIGTTGEMSELIIRFTKRGIVKEKGYGGGKLFTSGTKQIRDNGSGSSIKPGQTTKTEVEALFGRPYRVYAYEVLAGPEEEEWVFMYMDEGIVAPALAGAGIGLLSGLPFVGTISAVVAGKVMYSDKISFLSIRFLKEGVIKQIEKCETTVGGNKPKCESY